MMDNLRLFYVIRDQRLRGQSESKAVKAYKGAKGSNITLHDTACFSETNFDRDKSGSAD